MLYYTANDIATMLEVNPATVTNWQRRHNNFPEPTITNVTGHIKLWDETGLALIIEWRDNMMDTHMRRLVSGGYRNSKIK